VEYALSHRNSRGGAFAVTRESSDVEMLKGTLDRMILREGWDELAPVLSPQE
jgi:hypothetical protein